MSANDFLRAAHATGAARDMLLQQGKAALEKAARTPEPGQAGSGYRLLRQANSNSPNGK
jgi:hypothetical protein